MSQCSLRSSESFSQAAPSPHFADLSLYFSKFPLVSLGIPFQLVIVVLKTADQVAHLTVDGS